MDVSRTESINALGHAWVLSGTTSATCEKNGNKHYICSNNKAHTKDEINGTAKGHDYKTKYTMKQVGWDGAIVVRYKKCQNCSNEKDYESKTIHFAHNCGIADNSFTWSMNYDTGSFTIKHSGCGLNYTGSY